MLSKIKEVLKKEHGGQNCPWTDLQMEGLLLHELTLINKQLMNEPEYLMNKKSQQFFFFIKCCQL